MITFNTCTRYAFVLLYGLWRATAETSPPVPGITQVPLSTWKENISLWEMELDEKPEFAINTGWLTAKSLIHSDVVLYDQNDQCYGCYLLPRRYIPSNGTTVLIQTAFGNYIDIRTTSGDIVCSDHVDRLRERGDYWLIVYNTSSLLVACDLVLANDPTNYNLVILWAFLVLLGMALVWLVIKRLYRRCRTKHHHSTDITVSTNTLEMTGSDVRIISLVKEDSRQDSKKKGRLRSLDTFRGLSLLVMIFVNYGGGGYYFFEHAHWDGLFVADLVFPWFVWIMGVSIAFALRSQLKHQRTKWRILLKIVTRTIKIFLIGLFLGASYYQDMKTIRILGVLQRLALTYFGTAVTHLCFVTLSEGPPKWAACCRCKYLSDVFYYWPEWIIMFVIVSIQLCLTYLLPVPGCPTGYVGPGGLHKGGSTYNCTGGAAQYIDRMVLTESHMFQYPTIKELYKTRMPFDPEGILGTLTSIFMCFLGLQAGKIIAMCKSHRARIIRWTVWAIITGVIGAILCKGSQFDGWVPLNKNLWSISFILVLTSMAYILLIMLYVIIDVFKLWNGSPFVYPGMNSIVVYVCHSVFMDYFPVTWLWPDYTLHWQRLFRALWGVAIWTLMAYAMYLRKVFIAL